MRMRRTTLLDFNPAKMVSQFVRIKIPPSFFSNVLSKERYFWSKCRTQVTGSDLINCAIPSKVRALASSSVICSPSTRAFRTTTSSNHFVSAADKLIKKAGYPFCRTLATTFFLFLFQNAGVDGMFRKT
jgi:hypothetical protein